MEIIMEEQCKGKTKSGKRCKIKQGLVNGYCKFHSDQYAEKEDKGIDENHENDYLNGERTVADVADDVNKGLSGTVLIFIAIITFIGYLIYHSHSPFNSFILFIPFLSSLL